ncbi:MAG: GNAT family N-acetyltransferase [Pseudomonadota bacterium]
MTTLEITRTDPMHPDALALIDGSEREQSALYPPHLRYAFSPQQLVDGDVRFFVGRDGPTPIVCGGYAVCDGYGELKRIFVAKNHRGQGWADALVTACETTARAEALPLMRLETGLASPAAIAFYTRMGYTQIGPFGAYTENGSSVFMEKTL